LFDGDDCKQVFFVAASTSPLVSLSLVKWRFGGRPGLDLLNVNKAYLNVELENKIKCNLVIFK
jgi:hypothetical protein